MAGSVLCFIDGLGCEFGFRCLADLARALRLLGLRLSNIQSSFLLRLFFLQCLLR